MISPAQQEVVWLIMWIFSQQGDSLGVYNTCVPPAEASHSVSKVNNAPAVVSLDISDPNESPAVDGPGVCHTTEPPAVVCTVAATPTNYVIGSYVLA